MNWRRRRRRKNENFPTNFCQNFRVCPEKIAQAIVKGKAIKIVLAILLLFSAVPITTFLASKNLLGK